MFKRLVAIGAGTLLATGMGISAASAQTAPPSPDGSFTMTVNKTAYTNHWKTLITVTGTYKCSVTGGWNVTNSGIGADVTQIQGRKYVVRGQNGTNGPPLICDNGSHKWAFEVAATVNTMNGPSPATWKAGYVAANINGNVSDQTCDMGGCSGGSHNVGLNFDKVLQIVVRK